MARKNSINRAADSDHAEQPAQIDFESALSEIETIVGKLEAGDLTLGDSLSQYEAAVGKMKQCYALLDAAERKISVLAGFDADGNPVTEPLRDAGGSQTDDAASLLNKQKTRGQRRGVRSARESEPLGSGGESGDVDSDFDPDSDDLTSWEGRS